MKTRVWIDRDTKEGMISARLQAEINLGWNVQFLSTTMDPGEPCNLGEMILTAILTKQE